MVANLCRDVRKAGQRPDSRDRVFRQFAHFRQAMW